MGEREVMERLGEYRKAAAERRDNIDNARHDPLAFEGAENLVLIGQSFHS